MKKQSFSIRWDSRDFDVPSHDPTLEINQISLSDLSRASPYCSHSRKQHKVYDEKNQSIDKYLNSNEKKDSYLSLFGNDDELLKLSSGILPHTQFLKLANQTNNCDDPYKQRKIRRAQQKFYRKERQGILGSYYTKYLQWKEQPPQKLLQLTEIRDINPNQISVTDMILEKELRNQQWQLQKTRQKQKIHERRNKILQRNIESISEEYRRKMDELLLNKKFEVNLEEKRKEEKAKKMTYTKIQMPQISKQKKKDQPLPEKYKNSINYEYVSYVDLIRRPPKDPSSMSALSSFAYTDKNDPFLQSQKAEQQLQKTLKNQNHDKKWLWTLNIEEMLKIPHRQFLVFFEEHENKILGLTTPDELRRLKQYRDEAIQREKALRKLKQKISRDGKDVINRLSKQKKEKLFRILYEQQLQDQKDKIDQQINFLKQ